MLVGAFPLLSYAFPTRCPVMNRRVCCYQVVHGLREHEYYAFRVRVACPLSSYAFSSTETADAAAR